MNNWVIVLIAGMISTSVSFYTAVLRPQMQLNDLIPVVIGAGESYPSPRPGAALIGMHIYRESGCYYCHTRIVKPYQFGSDYERGWGKRRTVARDYIGDQPLLCGSLRLAPDLANIGLRNPENYSVPWRFSSTNNFDIERTARNMLILYDARLLNPDSIMPSYKQFFKTENSSNSVHSINAEGEFIFQDRRVIPLDDAKRLADYLSSLCAEHPLFEAPQPIEPSKKIMNTSVLTNIFKTTSEPLK